MSSPQYTLSKVPLTGKTRVNYLCAACGAKLFNPLEKAGLIDHCPDCATTHTVPGVPEKEKAERERAARIAEEAASKLEKQQEEVRMRERAQAQLEEASAVAKHFAAQEAANRKWEGTGNALRLSGLCLVLAGLAGMFFPVDTSIDGVENIGALARSIRRSIHGSTFCLCGLLMSCAGTVVNQLGKWIRDREGMIKTQHAELLARLSDRSPPSSPSSDTEPSHL